MAKAEVASSNMQKLVRCINRPNSSGGRVFACPGPSNGPGSAIYFPNICAYRLNIKIAKRQTSADLQCGQ